MIGRDLKDRYQLNLVAAHAALRRASECADQLGDEGARVDLDEMRFFMQQLLDDAYAGRRAPLVGRLPTAYGSDSA